MGTWCTVIYPPVLCPKTGEAHRDTLRKVTTNPVLHPRELVLHRGGGGCGDEEVMMVKSLRALCSLLHGFHAVEEEHKGTVMLGWDCPGGVSFMRTEERGTL